MSEDTDSDNRDAVVFASALVGQVNKEDVASMVQVQRDMLSRYEKTNEMLINFNLLSASRYEASVKDFHKHTQLLAEMRQDLDSVFKRIRVLKQRLSKAYPEAFAACSSVIMNMMEDEEEFEESQEDLSASGASTSSTQKSQQAPVQIKVDTHKEKSSSSDNVPGSQKKRHSSGDKGSGGSSTSHHGGRKEREGGRSGSGHSASHAHSHSHGHRHSGGHRSHSSGHKSGQSHGEGHSKGKTTR